MAQGGGFLWDNISWPPPFSNFDSSWGVEKKLEKKPLLVTVPCSGPDTRAVHGTRNCKRSSGGHEDGGREMGKDKGGGADGINEAKRWGAPSDHEAHIWTERERRKKMRSMFSTLHSLLPHLPPKADKATIVDEAVNYIKTLQLTLRRLQTKKQAEMIHGSKDTKSPSTSYEPSTIIPATLAGVSREAFMADQVASSGRTEAAASTTNKSSMLMKNSSAAAAAVRTGYSASTSVAAQLPHHRPLIHPPPPPPAAAVLQTWTSPNLVLNIMSGDDQAQFTVCCPKKSGLLADICFVLDKHKIDVVYVATSSDANRSVYTIGAQVPPNNGTGVAAAATQFSDAVVGVEETFKQAAAEMMHFI